MRRNRAVSEEGGTKVVASGDFWQNSAAGHSLCGVAVVKLMDTFSEEERKNLHANLLKLYEKMNNDMSPSSRSAGHFMSSCIVSVHFTSVSQNLN